MSEESRCEKKIILHSCCAICSGYPISYLKDLGYQVLVCFYNPNIYPESEYQKRLEAQRTLCTHLECEIFECDYEPEKFYSAASGLENEPEKGKRCEKCFELRLEKTAQVALESGIKDFTTSIVISPHKNFDLVSKTGQNIARKYGLNYHAINFRKQDGFLKTNKIANELGLYRQNYCGCKFSMKSYN